MNTEPIRTTNWVIGLVVILLQAAIMWSMDLDVKAIVGLSAGDAVGFLVAGEITRRRVVSADTWRTFTGRTTLPTPADVRAERYTQSDPSDES